MDIIVLDKNQIKEIYETSMLKDFPDNERKPLAMIHKGMDNGTYECIGLVNNDVIIAYAIFIKKGLDYLFDYFAVIDEHRNKGIGAEFLKHIAAKFQSANSVVGEVEDPDCAHNEEDKKLQHRRLNFYLRNGYRDTGVRVKLFDVNYIVLELDNGRGHTKEELCKIYKAHYRAILPLFLYALKVKIKRMF